MPLTLDSPVQFVKGIGPRKAEALAEHGINTVLDLLHYFPRGYIDRTNTIEIGKVAKDSAVTLVGKVLAQGSMYGGRNRRFEIVLGDDTGHISLLWFKAPKYLENRFKKGDLLAATGVVGWYNGYQLVHPEIEPLDDEGSERTHTGRIVPLYPSTAELTKLGLQSRGFRRSIKYALDNCAESIPDHLPQNKAQEVGLPEYNTAIRQIHFPDDEDTREAARRRLSFEELCELQFLVLRHKQQVEEIKKQHTLAHHGELVRKFAAALPFKLTPGQREALKVIYEDMASDKPMNRLLQGDVGCGKTVVAVAAGVYAAENNLQTAFMAPTELLAEQHYRNWRQKLEDIGVSSALLTGSLKQVERNLIGSRISTGETQLVFGTHALFSESVQFKNLGLVIIDEQHRFGVAQRAKLIAKGASPDTLVMSATPIPRTLALTLYGDLNFATIKDLPPGRAPVKTVWRMASERDKIHKFIAERVANREQVFIIYPLVQRSENTDLIAAEEAFKDLKEETFPKLNVEMIHGQMKVDKQERVIRAFARGKVDVLVATTVVEVGVDIPGATVMVIEHAERFGLAQLHQLRGRVGRGSKPGYAVAVASPPVSDVSRKRLNYLVAHSDGFEIAEADLKLRGPGEIFGFRQSGALNFRLANLGADQDLLERSREWISALLEAEGADSSGSEERKIV
ncbi:MAG TPA: ATP-dependent DNA helicase RecG, partial [candidate division Zixibacteria bacterium]|nr:ATP-dependent DNA helicase RecG [candidate division Zixibacteria bacterium]